MSVKKLTPSKAERILGFLYLAFEQLLLPGLLGKLFGLLPFSVGAVWINLTYFILNFAAILVIFRNFLNRSFRALSKQFWRFLGISLLGFVLYWATNLALSTLLNLLFPGHANINDTTVSALAGSNLLIMALGTVVLVPLTEEVLFRGVVFGSFPGKHKALAYILSTALFCLVHVLGYVGSYPAGTLILCFIQYIPAGLCLAWAYDASGSIFSPVLIHTVVNALGILSLR